MKLTLIKIKYPNRATKFVRNTFELSKLDGMGQALLEQQQVEDMILSLRDRQTQALAGPHSLQRIEPRWRPYH